MRVNVSGSIALVPKLRLACFAKSWLSLRLGFFFAKFAKHGRKERKVQVKVSRPTRSLSPVFNAHSACLEIFSSTPTQATANNNEDPP